MTDRTTVLLADVRVRAFLRAERIPRLARPLVAAGIGKPRGARRILYRLAKRLHLFFHRTMTLPADGRLAITAAGDGWRSFPADFGNTGYIDALRRVDRGGYEPDVTDVFEALAPGAAVVYDIGTNWGYFTALLLSNPAFSGSIHGFEIAPRTFRDYARMIDQGGFAERVTCHAHGLSDRDGAAAIREGAHTGLTRIVEGNGNASVPVRRLDDLDLPPPDLIKMDVEGHETAVLRGARQLLETARPVVVLESWHDERDLAGMLAPLRLLTDVGYDLYQIAWMTVDGEASVLRGTRPDGAPGAVNRVALVPLALDRRPLVADALNVVAIHPARRDGLLSAFRPTGA